MLVEGIQGKQKKKGFFLLFSFVFPLMLVEGIKENKTKNEFLLSVCG